MQLDYTYNATVVRVIDGDTIVVDLDLGRKIVMHDEVIRLHGIDSPETHGETKEAGDRATEYLASMLPSGAPLVVESIKVRDREMRGKYGRYVARLWLPQQNGSLLLVNRKMVSAGHAVAVDWD